MNQAEKPLIRPATAADRDAVVAIYREAIRFLNDQGNRQWSETIYPTPKTADDALEAGTLHVVERDATVCGTVILNEIQHPSYAGLTWRYNDGPQLVMHTLAVHPAVGSRGIATDIVRYSLDYARSHGYDAVRLDVFPPNKAAVALYQKFGFEYVGKVYFDFKEEGYRWYDCYELKL